MGTMGIKQEQPAKRFYLPKLKAALIVLAAASVIFGLVSYFGRELLAAKPLAKSLPFRYLRSAIISPKGKIVAVDSGERRLLGLDSDARLSFIIKGERRNNGFYNGRPLGFDSLGRFYIDDTVMDMATNNTARRQILRFSETGKLIGFVDRFDFKDEAMSDWTTHPIYSQIRGDTLFLFKNDGKVWTLRATPLVDSSTGKADVVQVRELGDFDAYAAVDIAVISIDEFYVLAKDGSLSRWTALKGLEPWFRNDGATGALVRFPTLLAVDYQGRILVDDGKRIVYRFDPRGDAVPVPILSPNTARKASYPGEIAFQDIAATSDGGLILGNEFSGELLTVSVTGAIKAIPGVVFGSAFRVVHALVWGSLALVILCGIGFVVVFYVMAFRRPSYLIVKQLLAFVPLIIVMVALVSTFVYQGMASALESQIKDRLQHLAQLGASRMSSEAVDADPLETARLEELLGSESHKAIVGVIDELVNLNGEDWNSYIYPYLYRKAGGVWWAMGSFEYVELYPYFKTEFDRVMVSAEPLFFRYGDVYGSWLSACAPVKRPDGSVAAVFEACMSANIVDEAQRGYVKRAALGGLAILGAFLLVFGAFTGGLLRSVRTLKSGAARLASGDYAVEVRIKSRDEIEELGDSFNSMSREIKSYVDKLEGLGRANARFVPSEFLSRLGRQSITEIGLGDQVLTDMTILFSDIRDFTKLTEKLGPAGTMDFLNDYLSRMGPSVRACGGFIDKYVGDMIMALFPNGPDGAVEAVLAMMESLDKFREELSEGGEWMIEAGFGIHAGPLMMGIIGEEERFEGTVIADAVNLASRIESLTKFYGVRALVSGDIKDQLKQARRLRFIDIVNVKGKSHPVRLYELIAKGDPAAQAKISSMAAYVRGFEEYRRAAFGEAAQSFREALTMAPDDKPAKIMLGRCLQMSELGAPPDWKGVTEFHEK